MDEDRLIVSRLEKQLDETWNLIDELFASMSAEDWQRKHGSDWIFADLPWHLAYIDRDFVLIPTRKGPDIPERERLSFPSGAALNEWNDAMIASRPREQPVEESIQAMRIVRGECRDLIATMTDASLDEKSWFPLVILRGWRTKAMPVNFCFNHTFSHFMEARLRLGRSAPSPSPDLTHARLAGIMDLVRLGLNKDAVAATKMTIGMNFTGPGGGSWTVDVNEGDVSVEEKAASKPEIEMTQSPETFEAVAVRAINPMWAMITGKIKIKGKRNIAGFFKLLSPPPLTEVMEPV
jgi:hypothetical protein